MYIDKGIYILQNYNHIRRHIGISIQIDLKHIYAIYAHFVSI